MTTTPPAPSFYETPRDNLKVKPLTVAERRWCEELAVLLSRAPKRLGLCTIGDRSLTVIDQVEDCRLVATTGDDHLHDGGASKHGFDLGIVFGRITIHGVSG